MSTLKKYIELCAGKESGQILGTVCEVDDDDEEDIASGSEVSFDLPIQTNATSSSSSATVVSTNFSISSTAKPLTTTITQVPNKTNSIYSIAEDIENSSIINGRFSAINFQFGETTWKIMNHDYSPEVLISTANYDLTSSKSPLMNYLQVVAKFIFDQLKLVFPYELPYRHAWELSSIFASKYPQIENMFQTYKFWHPKAAKFVDVSVSTNNM